MVDPREPEVGERKASQLGERVVGGQRSVAHIVE
jgi:hypothetical protein